MSLAKPLTPAEQQAKEARQKKFLLILFGVFALIAVWRLLPDFGGDGDTGTVVAAEDRRGGSRRPQRAEKALPDEVVELNVAALDPKAQDFEIGRNLWTFYQPPPPPPPPRP
ncbi:MAG: hypothetical protein KDD11_20280, partial [Acidobacteria bacterium]|nr:hypothetical protein [Acidobacteriota bacterium]